MRGSKISFFLVGLLAVCLEMSVSMQTYAQDVSPYEIKAFVFFVSQETIDGYLKDGITKSELAEMQEEHFKAAALLPQAEPFALKLGDNAVDIPADRADALKKASGKQAIVFFFDFVRPKEASAAEASIERRSYAIAADAKSVLVKEGKLRIPVKANQYRFFDYRSAALFKSGQAAYELNLGDNKTVKLILKAPKS